MATASCMAGDCLWKLSISFPHIASMLPAIGNPEIQFCFLDGYTKKNILLTDYNGDIISAMELSNFIPQVCGSAFHWPIVNQNYAYNSWFTVHDV